MSQLLAFKDVHAFYGAAHVLHGVSLAINEGDKLALIGRNGVGKTTVVNSLLGLTKIQQGHVLLNSLLLRKPRTYQAAQNGIAIVPQGRRIIANLTVEENLLLGRGRQTAGKWHLDRIYELFPILKERANTSGIALSGGQQQILAVGRALMTNPNLLVLDEPTEGLAPVIVDQLVEILNYVADQGCALFLIEQNLDVVRRVTRQFLAMTKGQVVAQGDIDPSKEGIAQLEQHILI